MGRWIAALYVGTHPPTTGEDAGDVRGEVLRSETLFLCAEEYEEHILEVRLSGIRGLDAMHSAIRSLIMSRVLVG